MKELDMTVEDFIESIKEYADSELQTVTTVIENEMIRRHESEKMKLNIRKEEKRQSEKEREIFWRENYE